uniref:proteasome assembly chaperone 1 n=1 Tax=Myxine glutinosa TaxID=7769 RepID=UPI00358EC31E
MSDSLWSFDAQQPPARDWDEESDEEEEERSEEEQSGPRLTSPPLPHESYELLVISCDAQSNAFISGCVLRTDGWTLVGDVSCDGQRRAECEGEHRTEKLCTLHEHSKAPRTLIGCCSFIPENVLYDLTDMFLKYASGSKGTDALPEKQNSSLKVVILTSLPLSSYLSPHSTDQLPTPLVRSLSTEPYLLTLERPAPQLEVPNIVTGIAAATLTECALQSISATLLLSYSSLSSHDPVTISSFFKPAHLTPMASLLRVSPTIYTQPQLVPSNLYC